jgi:hypothetical protein
MQCLSERRAEWKRITGSDEATTKVLCDHIRIVLENEHAKRQPEMKGHA